jgi:hypothetical protein
VSKSRTTQILYTRRRDVTTDGELNVLASVYRFILFESSGPSKKGAESVPESSSRDAAVIVRNKKEVTM